MMEKSIGMNAAAGTRLERLVTKMPEEKKKKAPAKKKPTKEASRKTFKVRNTRSFASGY